MTSLTSLTQHQAIGDATAKIARLSLHKETVSNLSGGQAGDPRGMAAAKTKGHSCAGTCKCSYTCTCNATMAAGCTGQCW